MNLQVAAIFRDEGISGGLFDPPEMQKLIQFLEARPQEKFVIIFDDLSRFARDVEVYIKLKTEIEGRGAKFECLNFKIEDTEESRMVEIMMAAVAEYDRKRNRRQVKQKMKARLEDGYWSFCPPPGLKNQASASGEVMLMPHQPLAGIYKEAIERFRDFELLTIESCRQFVLQQYAAMGIRKPLSLHGMTNMLKNPLYVGYLEYHPWEVELREGKHEGFISWNTYLAVQDRIAHITKPRLRKDYSADFPLRPDVSCLSCHTPMTGSWHRGKQGTRYPHYWCKNRSCPRVNKTIPRDVMEKDFTKLLKELRPDSQALDMVEAILQDSWQQRQKGEYKEKNIYVQQIKELDEKIAGFLERIPKTTSEVVVRKYESEVEKYLGEKKCLENETAVEKYSDKEFGTASKLVFEYIKNPIAMWQSPHYEDKKLLLAMYFEGKLTYGREIRFGTPELPHIIRVSREKAVSKVELVDTGENTSNPVIDYLTRFWKYYQATPALQNILVKG